MVQISVVTVIWAAEAARRERTFVLALATGVRFAALDVKAAHIDSLYALDCELHYF